MEDKTVGNSDNGKGNGDHEAQNTIKKARLREEFATLHREMEIAERARTKHGQPVRKVPRNISLIRTKKRKLLEKDDIERHAIHAETEGKRLRGAKKAFDDTVLQDNLLHFPRADIGEEEENEENEQNDQAPPFEESSYTALVQDENVQEVSQDESAVEDSQIEDSQAEEDDDDDEEEEEEDDEDEDEDDDKEEQPDRTAGGEISRKGAENTLPRKQSKKKKAMFRMRNFKSHAMAQRHGEALGAHARGLQKTAVEKLGNVAHAAPDAPQIYSSLGLVYENKLEELRHGKKQVEGGQGRDESTSIPDSAMAPEEEDSSTPRQLKIAIKAYGSFHVAAVLCKKDFSLWVRAGDAAVEIATLHSDLMTNPDSREKHRAEKKRWMEEALKDYTTADNLKPPGINVPAKLASTHMELGNLAEALTILTDLRMKDKKRKSITTARSELERSYRVWYLYADLMLRIGHECLKWNRNDESNGNYMFRRWLRKYSLTFDWRERRLQALCLALEAAAGSTACSRLVEWTHSQSKESDMKNSNAGTSDRWRIDDSDMGVEVADKYPDGNVPEESALDDVANEGVVDDTHRDTSAQAEAGEPVTAQKEQDDKLPRFDSKVSSVDEPTTLVGDESEKSSRNADYWDHDQDIATEEPGNNYFEPIPMSASCASTCSIASELMKHCLALNLYKGGRLVGESVSLYFKERAARIERKSRLDSIFMEKQRSNDGDFLGIREDYDDMNEGYDDASDDDAGFLSDDEELNESDYSLVQSLQRGLLPAELRVLYALNLIGEGGRNFVAFKCIESIQELDKNDKEIAGHYIDTFTSPDPSRVVFRLLMTSHLTSSSALALLGDLLRATGKEKEWSNRLVSFFQSQVETIKTSMTQGTPTSMSTLDEIRKNENSKIILECATLTIYCAESSIERSQESEIKETGDNSASMDLLNVINMLLDFRDLLWQPLCKGTPISPISTEFIRLVERASKLAMIDVEKQTNDFRVLLLDRLRQVVSMIRGPVESEAVEDMKTGLESLEGFPISSSWQDRSLEAVSLRCHNLCVGCSVSMFSGWEMEEFSAKSLYFNRSSYVGVNVQEDKRVVGYLSKDVEKELLSQWEEAKMVVPLLSLIELQNAMSKVKECSWYKDALNLLKASMAKKEQQVELYAEKEALCILLRFSRLSFLVACTEEDAMKERTLKEAMSVIMPISQFCVEQRIWDSTIGYAAATKSQMYQLERAKTNFAADVYGVNQQQGASALTAFFETPGQTEATSAAPSRTTNSTDESKWMRERREKDAFETFVKVPVSLLLREWRQDEILDMTQTYSQDAKEAMEKLDATMRQLKLCFTINSIQKVNIQVAVALLKIASLKECHNPFLCLHHASIFAALGAKLGQNDEPFKEMLPKEIECTPIQALAILGRADCLQELHFLEEAMYLCSFVVRVCLLHRDSDVHYLAWTSQWRAVRIHAYTVSVAIEATIGSLDDLRGLGEAELTWDPNTKDELELARKDASDLVQYFLVSTGVAETIQQITGVYDLVEATADVNTVPVEMVDHHWIGNQEASMVDNASDKEEQDVQMVAV